MYQKIQDLLFQIMFATSEYAYITIVVGALMAIFLFQKTMKNLFINNFNNKPTRPFIDFNISTSGFFDKVIDTLPFAAGVLIFTLGYYQLYETVSESEIVYFKEAGIINDRVADKILLDLYINDETTINYYILKSAVLFVKNDDAFKRGAIAAKTKDLKTLDSEELSKIRKILKNE